MQTYFSQLLTPSLLSVCLPQDKVKWLLKVPFPLHCLRCAFRQSAQVKTSILQNQERWIPLPVTAVYSSKHLCTGHAAGLLTFAGLLICISASCRGATCRGRQAHLPLFLQMGSLMPCSGMCHFHFLLENNSYFPMAGYRPYINLGQGTQKTEKQGVQNISGLVTLEMMIFPRQVIQKHSFRRLTIFFRPCSFSLSSFLLPLRQDFYAPSASARLPVLSTDCLFKFIGF